MHRVKAVSILLTALLLLLIASAVFAQYSPDVLIVDQDVVDGEVTVARATVNGPGWVAVYADEDGEPGAVIGYAPLMNGINANIMVDLDLDSVTDQLYAVLHEDMGFVGTFEYPGDDMPVMDDDELIIAPFQATGTGNTVAGVVSESEGFGSLLAALQAADLVDVLRGEGPFTVFAPTDDAFDAMPADELDELLRDTEALGTVLRSHVVAGELTAEDLVDGFEAETLDGSPLTFTVDGDTILVNDAAIAETNDGPVNGIIHAIASILMPKSEEEAAVEEEEEPEAPSNVAGSYQESDGSSITVANVVAGNDGWLAIRIDNSFTPGDVLGYAAVPAGEHENVVVELDEPLAEDAMVWAVLHADDGKIGDFEFPDADEPVHYNNSTVMAPFNVVIAEMAEEEAMADEGEEADDDAETGVMAGVTDTVTSFIGSFLTLKQDEPAEEKQDEPAEEAMAEETPVAEEEAAAEETPEAEATEEAVEEAPEEAAEEETEATDDAETGVMAGVTETVTSFLGSFLTLGQDAPADEAMAEETPATEEAATEEVAEEEAPEEAEAMEPMDIVDTATAAGTFETLLAALDKADLADALKAEGPFTVFAPTDDAFAALPEGALDDLFNDTEKLTQVLLYHVVPDKLMAADIEKMGESLTLEGDMLPLSVDGDTVMVGEAEVTGADVEALNGVIHVIDSVLMPPMAEEEAAAAAEAAEAEAAAKAAAEEAAAAAEAAAEAAAKAAAEEAAEKAEEEAAGAMTDASEAVGSFLQSFLTLNQDDDMGEEAAEGDDDAEGHDDDMAEEGEETAEGHDDDAMAEEGDDDAEGHDDEMAEGDDDAMAEETEAPMEVPDELPETGLSLSSAGTTLPVVGLVMMFLVAGAFVTRRRPV